MRVRRVAVAAVIVCGVVLPTVSTAAAAAPTKPAVAQASAAKPIKPVASKPPVPAKPTKPAKPVKPVKPVKFAASGAVNAVDVGARTVTVAVKGGASDLRGTIVTVNVPTTARITVNDVQVLLADVKVGYTVNVQGDKVGSVYNAARVNATGVPAVEPSPTTEPSTT